MAIPAIGRFLPLTDNRLKNREKPPGDGFSLTLWQIVQLA